MIALSEAAALYRSPANREPADLRLILPALSAWVAAFTVLGLAPEHRSWCPPLAVLAVAVALLLLVRPVERHRRMSLLLAATILTATAATVTTLLHTADLHRGPLPALARSQVSASVGNPDPADPSGGAGTPKAAPSPELTVSLTIAGDPEVHTSHARGTSPGRSLLTVAAIVDSVTLPQSANADASGAGPSPKSSAARPSRGPTTAAPGTPIATPPGTSAENLAGNSAGTAAGTPRTVRTRTPVTVMVHAQDADAWHDLLPSTRLRTDVRVLPAREGAQTAAVLLARGQPELLIPPSLPQRLAGRLRAGLRAACEHLPADVRGLLPGLVVGDTSGLPDDLNEAFHATDLSHLTAVSGANLMIVLTVLVGAPGHAGTSGRGGLAGRLGLPLRVTAVLGAGLTLAFVTVCRPDPSVLRAAATGLVGMLALGTGRPRQALPALTAAVLGLILLDPHLARSYGFVLSVLATTGLLTLGPRWMAALVERRWPHHLASAVAATAAAQALCAPVTILLAPRVSLAAVPCNLLAEPAVAPTTLLGFAALVADPVSHPAARFLADLAALPVAWLAGVARTGAALPGAQLAWPGGPFGAILLALTTVALVWAARPFLIPARPTASSAASAVGRGGAVSPSVDTRRNPFATRRVRAVLTLVLGLIMLVVLLRPPTLTRIATGWPPKGWQLVMCDIGQGDMTVLPIRSAGGESPDSAIVVDTGPDPHAADTCLRDLGITKVPLLILSHFHADHAEGLPGVLHGRRVGALQVTTLDTPAGEYARVVAWAAAAGVPVVRAKRGEHRFAGPELSWDVLWPDSTLGPATPGANNASVALLAAVGPSSGPLRIALLGDLEPPAQAALHARLTPPRVDVLKVAHHGSGNQDWDFTAALHPHLALISCGSDNPYGHPAAQTVSRLRALGATVMRTDQVGDIAILGTPSALSVATHPRHPESPARAPPLVGVAGKGSCRTGCR
ncbi:hypothetical protein GCM10010430_47150 [Kitasatospora cystarginea]|uniref:Metallo-beta-lactamase domain-containing protein n=1 Tax=Kitasatospora cystarginea TaxID=58350 RepID=A0ABP5RGG5_9ACTN